MDARREKTTARLRDAVVQLATAGPITDVSVSRLAQTARVHRSTVYTYASSPVELLQGVLRARLDELRRAYLLDVAPEDAAAAIAGVTRAVLEHVDEYDVIYRRGLGTDSGSASLHALLSEHFEESIELLLDQHSVSVPAENAQERRMIARYLADGIIGAIDVWLRGPPPRHVDALFAVLTRVTPAWWPGSAAAEGGATVGAGGGRGGRGGRVGGDEHGDRD